MGRGGYPVVKRQQGRSPMIAKWLSEGLQHHQQGRLAQAEALYRRVLEKEPKHPDTLHLLGMVAYQAGQHERAAGLIGRAAAVPVARVSRGLSNSTGAGVLTCKLNGMFAPALYMSLP